MRGGRAAVGKRRRGWVPSPSTDCQRFGAVCFPCLGLSFLLGNTGLLIPACDGGGSRTPASSLYGWGN